MKKFVISASVVALCAVAGLTIAGEPAKNTGMPSKSMIKPSATPTAPMANYAEGTLLATAAKDGKFNTFVKAVEITGLTHELTGAGPYTIFAPTDEAFAKLGQEKLEKIMLPENRGMLKRVLMYHVVSGNVMAADVSKMTYGTTLNGQRFTVNAKNGVMVDNSKVVTPDIKCSNGVLHVLDSVMMPETKNVLEVAQASGKFNTFYKAVEAAGMNSTLESDGPFTILAPTDEAFAKLPAGTLENLLKPANKAQLVSLLGYHVIPTRVFADQAFKTTTFKTVQGTDVKFSNANNTPMVNNAKITGADIDANNGVIHVIDTVIMPAAH